MAIAFLKNLCSQCTAELGKEFRADASHFSSIEPVPIQLQMIIPNVYFLLLREIKQQDLFFFITQLKVT